jgi:alcohol dehydrogenase class IV
MTSSELLDAIDREWPRIDGFVAVTDPVAASLPAASAFLEQAAATYVVAGRPTLPEANAIAELLGQTGASVVVGMGSGVALDTAKLAVLVLDESGHRPSFVAVPCGPEPYRAVTGFAMYDAEPGVRTGVYRPWLPALRVHVVPELLEEVEPAIFALFCGDSLVHAIESLLNRGTTAESELHAKRAANVFVDQAFDAAPDRGLLVEASMHAALAFEMTKLGLAHALSRPMGIAARASHDMFNLMLGASVVEFWGDETLRTSALASGVALDPIANLWIELLQHYQARAGLPESLSETALVWDDVERALEWAPKSSGIPHLPRPVDDDDLARVARSAWSATAG